MPTKLHQLEERTGLKPKDAYKLLDIPLPTYYQYRRTGVMPAPVSRMIDIILAADKRYIAQLLEKYVYDDEL